MNLQFLTGIVSVDEVGRLQAAANEIVAMTVSSIKTARTTLSTQ